MWGVYLWKAGDSVAKKKCTLENWRSNKWLNGLKKKKRGGGRKKTNNKTTDNKIRCLHWIWRVCKTAWSLFPNLQKSNPENNTVIWSNKEKALFFFFFPLLLAMFVKSTFLFLTKQRLCHDSSGLASSKLGCSWSSCTTLIKLTSLMLLILPVHFPGRCRTCLS